MAGASLHPYVRWTYGQTWTPREACLGPIRSVLGLAPGETVTIEVRHRSSVDYTSLMRNAADRAETSSHTERNPELHEQTRSAVQQMKSELELAQLHYKELGSPFLELIVGAIIGAAQGQKKQADRDEALDAMRKQLEHEKGGGGGGTINHNSLGAIHETLEEVHRSESEHTATETTRATGDGRRDGSDGQANVSRTPIETGAWSCASSQSSADST